MPPEAPVDETFTLGELKISFAHPSLMTQEDWNMINIMSTGLVLAQNSVLRQGDFSAPKFLGAMSTIQELRETGVFTFPTDPAIPPEKMKQLFMADIFKWLLAFCTTEGIVLAEAVLFDATMRAAADYAVTKRNAN